MNIPVITSEGLVYARPDTSWNRRSEDIYVQPRFDSVGFTPAIFAHCSLAGKAIAERFASRYYDALGYGILLYMHPFEGAAAFAASACLDGTSVLPEISEFERNALSGEHFGISLHRQDGTGIKLFSFSAPDREEIHRKIAQISSSCLVRRGDLLCMEAEPEKILCLRGDGSCRITLKGEKRSLIDLNIIFA